MFQLPDKALQALAGIGVPADAAQHIAFFAEFWEEAGAESFWSLVDGIRYKRELAVSCFPSLLAYAAECRLKRPAPTWDSLTDAELEQIRLMTEAVRKLCSREGAFDPVATRPYVITTTLVGLVTLPTFLPDPSPHAVILLDDEFDAWIESIGEEKRTDPWWYEKWWFRVHCAPNDERLKDGYGVEDIASLRSRGEVWELSFGTASGGLAAVGREQLFVWDGVTAVKTEFESLWVA